MRRGGTGGLGGLGGGGGSGLLGLLFSLVGSRFGLIGIALVVGAYFLLNSDILRGPSAPYDEPSATRAVDSPAYPKTGDERVEFVSFVLDDVQDTWTKIFAKQGTRYERAKMVLFEGATQTACGYGQSATGPFYCPNDQRVYLDLSFFRALDAKLGAPGDFAQAYVIAHEVGHHVQNQLGLTDRVHGASPSEQRGATGLSVRLELQADCFAGVWANATGQRDLLERGDLEEAFGAAAAVGDDRIQKQSQGTVQPEKWTHGSSAQRKDWFNRGYESGSLDSCDTFRTASR